MLTQKQFTSILPKIAENSGKLQDMIHQAALFALFHANVHNNTTPAKELIEVLPKSQRRETLKVWFIKFGQFQVTNGVFQFKGKKRITDNPDKAFSDADETPYWELVKEQSAEQQVVSINFEKRILGLFMALEKADKVEHQELLKVYWDVTPESIREKLFA